MWQRVKRGAQYGCGILVVIIPAYLLICWFNAPKSFDACIKEDSTAVAQCLNQFKRKLSKAELEKIEITPKESAGNIFVDIYNGNRQVVINKYIFELSREDHDTLQYLEKKTVLPLSESNLYIKLNTPLTSREAFIQEGNESEPNGPWKLFSPVEGPWKKTNFKLIEAWGVDSIQ